MSRIKDFLAQTGWSAATRAPLAGDASSRRYERLALGAERAVLMDDAGGNIGPFLAIARHLSGHGFSAPQILAASPAQGLILMEDLGDDLLFTLLARDPSREEELYRAAVDFLAALHRLPPPGGLVLYTPARMAGFIAPTLDFYAPACGAPVPGAARDRLLATLETALEASDIAPPVLIHRDFHVQNLLWLPNRQGPARLGLLDFQDAAAGHPAYDLVSLLEDARRDVPPALREAMIARYLAATGQDESRFRAGFAAQGAQRALRILGIFARLCTVAGKPGYVDLIPRVWAGLQSDLAHPTLAALRTAVAEALPAPTPERLARIRKAAA